MQRRRRASTLAAAAWLLLAGLGLPSCGGGEGEASPTETTVETETTTTETTATTPAGPTVVRIAVVDGSPRGGIVREAVARGDRVVLVVTSDVSDHVHVHGYDLVRDIRTGGGTVRIAFRATLPGRFEVELEDRGVQLAELTVRP